ncbi:MAG: alpha-amylase family glycosyl hydrolase, partial [Anaerolineaceae bacterium]
MSLISACQRSPAAQETEYRSPDWFKTAVVYEIFVRSFRDANGDGIGDLNGITESLDYLQKLGVNTLWLTPIFSSPSYHGYDVSDYYRVNPDYGTQEDLIRLVNAAHERGMYIILDYVASHMSSRHPFFVDALNNPSSEYADYFLWKDEAHSAYQSYQGHTSMPTVNHASEKANRYFLDVAKYWMDLNQDGDYTDGIDGWRCDYAMGTPEAFWRSLRSELKAVNPDVLLLGEVWVKEPSGQVGYFTDAFDAQFDFPLYFTLEGDPAIAQDGLISGKSLVSLATDRVKAGETLFDPQSILVRFLNNHDMDRAASETGSNPARDRLGALLIASLNGVPMIYYGEEIGMTGRRGSGPLYDEFRREPMEWGTHINAPGTTAWFTEHRYIQDADGISVEEQDADPASLLNFYRTILTIRKENPALSAGKYTQIAITPPNSQIWAFWRYTDDQVIGVFFNFGEAEVAFTPDLSQMENIRADEAVELFHTGEYKTDAGEILLAPASAVLLTYS